MDELKKRVLEQLHLGVAKVVFTKVNGERREMNCTLVEDLMPVRSEDPSNQTRKENPEVQSVWDIDKQAWRSFRWDKLIEDEN